MNAEDVAIELGYQIKRERARTGLSQREVSEETGISRQAISAIENGQGSMKLEMIFSISKALDVPLGELITAAEQEAHRRASR